MDFEDADVLDCARLRYVKEKILIKIKELEKRQQEILDTYLQWNEGE